MQLVNTTLYIKTLTLLVLLVSTQYKQNLQSDNNDRSEREDPLNRKIP